MPGSDIRTLFDSLAGKWRLERAIPENGASMTGTAQFVRAAKDILDYFEAGTMNYRQGPHEVERHYRYELKPDAIRTYFADGPDAGKLFEQLTPAASRAGIALTGDHLCIDDHYVSLYTFKDADHFTVVHKVKGPAKNYVSTTHYSRLSNQP